MSAHILVRIRVWGLGSGIVAHDLVQRITCGTKASKIVGHNRLLQGRDEEPCHFVSVPPWVMVPVLSKTIVLILPAIGILACFERSDYYIYIYIYIYTYIYIYIYVYIYTHASSSKQSIYRQNPV